MVVYRIVKSKGRANDLSGIGAFNEGGRWNNTGTYALYSSENRALAALELLAHFEYSEMPPGLFIMSIEISDTAGVYNIVEKDLPAKWISPENLALKSMGDNLLRENKYIAIKAPSAVMPYENNYILNPRYNGYNDLVKIIDIVPFNFDERLFK